MTADDWSRIFHNITGPCPAANHWRSAKDGRSWIGGPWERHITLFYQDRWWIGLWRDDEGWFGDVYPWEPLTPADEAVIAAIDRMSHGALTTARARDHRGPPGVDFTTESSPTTT